MVRKSNNRIFICFVLDEPFLSSLREHTYMTSTQKGGERVENCHVSADYIVFKQQIYVHFLHLEGVWDHKIGKFLWTS